MAEEPGYERTTVVLLSDGQLDDEQASREEALAALTRRTSA